MKTLIVTLATCVILLGCELREKAGEFQQMAEAAQEKLEAGDSAGALSTFLGGGEAVQPVDFRTLKDMLPGKLEGMARENASGEKSSVMGIGTSKAEGRYRSEGTNGRIDLSILDYGSMRGITMMGFAWTLVKIDNETDKGYERTVKYKGYPAYVKYERGADWSRGQMSVVVVDRFVVTANGNNVGAEAIRGAIDKVDLEKLKDLKDAGVGEAPPGTPDIADFTPPKIPVTDQQGQADENDQPRTMGDVLDQMNGGQTVDPIDFKELKAMLPEEVPGMKRTNAEGQKGGAMGVMQSSASGTYQAEGDRRTKIIIRIKDLGNLKSVMMMGGYAWTMMQTDKESDTGFERTTTHMGYPAFESYSSAGRPKGKIQTIVGNRFAVEVEGQNVEWEVIQRAIDQVDLKGLEARKDDGVTSSG